MFTWLSNLLAPKKRDPGPSMLARETTPGTSRHEPPRQPSSPGIRYDAALIHRLKDDHRAFLRTYGGIKTAAEGGDWVTVEKTMLQFRSALTDHLMTESIKLYVYLQLTLAGDRERLALMRRFSSEMVGIGKVVLDFIDGNRDVSVNKEKQERFLEAWGHIGKTLGDRIAREEQTLYPMYDMPQESMQ